jgi:uncharacterized membrane protein YgcG
MKGWIAIAFVLLITFAILSFACSKKESTGTEKKFIEFQKRIDDRSGLLTENDIAKINTTLEAQEKAIGLKGYILILPEIEDWDTDEYARDLFNDWKSKGIVNSKSYIIIMSIEDHKFQIIRGKYIDSRENDYEITLLRNKMDIDLDKKDLGMAIVNYINGLGETSTLKKGIEQERKLQGMVALFMLIGIVILILVLVARKYIKPRRFFKQKEKDKRDQPFIE